MLLDKDPKVVEDVLFGEVIEKLLLTGIERQMMPSAKQQCQSSLADLDMMPPSWYTSLFTENHI